MKALAKAVVDAMAFLELSDDNVIDSDSAIQAMESIAADLWDATPEEKRALAEAASEELAARESAHAREEVLKFYRDFIGNFGWEGEGFGEGKKGREGAG